MGAPSIKGLFEEWRGHGFDSIGIGCDIHFLDRRL
jgi:hypothetical protein